MTSARRVILEAMVDFRLTEVNANQSRPVSVKEWLRLEASRKELLEIKRTGVIRDQA